MWRLDPARTKQISPAVNNGWKGELRLEYSNVGAPPDHWFSGDGLLVSNVSFNSEQRTYTCNAA